MKRVGIAQLKSHLSEHLRSAEAGETIEVMDRARAIARIGPIERDSAGLELIPAACAFSSVRGIRHAPAKLSMTSAEALRQERGPT